MMNAWARHTILFVALFGLFSSFTNVGLLWADEAKASSTSVPALVSTKASLQTGATYKSTVKSSVVTNDTFNIQFLDGSSTLNLSSSSKKESSEIILSKTAAKASQKWNIQDAGKGYYYIVNANSGQVLTYTKKGIVQTTLVKKTAQKWAIIANTDGTYTFISAANNTALSVAGSKTAVLPFNGIPTVNQSFSLRPTELYGDGIYSIMSQADKKKAVTSSEGSTGTFSIKMSIWDKSQGQKYELVSTGKNNTFYIRNAEVGLYITVNAKGKVLQVADEKKQPWKVVVNGSGVSFVSANKKTLGRTLAYNKKNALVSNKKYKNGLANQQFVLKSRQLFTNGTYSLHINSRLGLNVLDNAKKSKKDNANPVLKDYTASKTQKYKVSYLGKGIYTIVNVYSKKALSQVEDSIVLSGNGSLASQQWTAHVGANGSTILVNVETGKALQLDGKAQNGTGVIARNKSESAKQRWNLVNEQIKPYQKRALAKAKKRGSATNWYFVVNISNHRTTVLHRANKKAPWTIYRDWPCSTGHIVNGRSLTPLKDTTIRYTWRVMHDSVGPYWSTYYCTNLKGFFFHDIVYYYKTHKPKYAYLGGNNSHGCVRLATKNAKWIYVNNKMLKGSSVTTWK